MGKLMKKIMISYISTIACSAILSQSAIAAYGVPTYNSYRDVFANKDDQCKRILNDKNADPVWLKKCGYQTPLPTIEQELVLTPSAATLTTTISEEINIRANLLFAFDSDVLSSNARAVLDERMAKYRNKGRLTSKVEVVGHADSTGPEAYNQNLSERRAQAVAHYLEQNTNITDDKLNIYGQGENEPTASNKTKEGRSANRRVIIILNAEVVE